MKNNLVRIISLFISAVMVFTLLCGCSKSCKDSDTADVSSKDDIDYSDSDDTDDSDDFDDDWDDEDNWDDEDDWDDWDDDDDEDYDDEDDYEDDDEDDDEDGEEDEYVRIDDELHVYNSKTPIMTNYRGVSGSVYHAYGFMKDDSTGRVYTDEQMALELSRLYDSGIRYCRTRYTSQWAFDYSSGKYDFNSARFGYFCDYAKALAKQDTDVCLNFGWNFGYALATGKNWIAEIEYMRGTMLPDDVYTDAEQIASPTRFDLYPEQYAESVGFNLDQYTDTYWRNLAIVGLRYGEFMAQSLEQLKARGINNISHIYWFTEPSYPDSTTPCYKGYEADEYIFVMDIIMKKLEQRGVKSWVKHIGPDQGSIYHGDGLLRYLVVDKNRSDLFDVLSAHGYPSQTSSVSNTYGDYTSEVFSSYVQPLKDAGIFNNEAGKEFWIDEFYTRTANQELGYDDAWLGLQNCVSFIMAQQIGIQNISLWQIFDQLWVDQNDTSGEFVNGIHTCGSAPSLFVSSIPRGQYYATGLFSKYNGSKNGTVYETNNYVSDTMEMYIGCVELEDGNWTVTLVNAGMEDLNVTVDFEKAINKTLYRHVETVTETIPTTQAKLAGADKTFVDVEDKFCDTIPAASVVVYTSIKG